MNNSNEIDRIRQHIKQYEGAKLVVHNRGKGRGILYLSVREHVIFLQNLSFPFDSRTIIQAFDKYCKENDISQTEKTIKEAMSIHR